MKRPAISILVPTYRRPELLRRNLDRCAAALGRHGQYFELIVADNFSEREVNEVTMAFAARTGISSRYLGEPVTRNMQENHQRLLEAASGTHVNFVHDDDFLLPGAGENLLAAVQASLDPSSPIKNAVCLVDLQGRQIRADGMGQSRRLPPQQAVRRLISESSFVRFPAMLVPRQSFFDIGGFDASLGYIFDLGAWLALASKFGLQLSGEPTAAFTIHSGSETNVMYTRDFLDRISLLLSASGRRASLSDIEVSMSLRKFLWRFVLAGCKRAVRAGDFKLLRERAGLFSGHPLSHHTCPLRWLPLKLGFAILAGMPLPQGKQ